MKKILLIAAATVAMSISSYGATLSVICGNTANSADGGGNQAPAQVISCGVFNVAPGFQLTGVTIDLVTSYNGNVGAGPLVGDGTLALNVTYDPSVAIPATSPCNISGSTVTASTACLGAFSDGPFAPNTLSYAAFTIGVNFSLPTTDAGANTWNGQATANAYVNYTYDLIPTNGSVPEPTTVALMGAGLVALATAARRRRS